MINVNQIQFSSTYFGRTEYNLQKTPSPENKKKQKFKANKTNNSIRLQQEDLNFLSARSRKEQFQEDLKNQLPQEKQIKILNVDLNSEQFLEIKKSNSIKLGKCFIKVPHLAQSYQSHNYILIFALPLQVVLCLIHYNNIQVNINDPINSEIVTQEKTLKDQNQLTCLICFTNAPNSVIMECGHGGICYDCSLEIWKATNECYLCRNKITQVLQIDLNYKNQNCIKVISSTQMTTEINK